MRITSAALDATSVPEFRCTPMVAWDRAIASLVPSPRNMIVGFVFLLVVKGVDNRDLIYCCLSSGEQRERVSLGWILS